MTQALRALGAATLWLYALPLCAVTLLVDLLAWPFVLLARRRAEDEAPARRDAAIVIPSLDGLEMLRALLPSLEAAIARAPGNHEVIVVDNGSSDGTQEALAREFPRVRVVRLPENRFFIRGIRAGVDAASPDKTVLVLLNNDMVVEPDFLAALLARFGAPDLFATSARIELEGARVETGRTRFFRKRGALRQEQIAWQDGVGVEPALWAGGGSSAFDRAKYEALGGLEDLYDPCYMEDVSLSYAAWKRGWRIELEPRAVVHHRHRATSRRVFGEREVERIDRRNRELFFWRSVTDPVWVVAHALYMPWNALKDGKRTGVGLQVRAIWATLPRIPQALVARQRARCAQRRRDRDVLGVWR